MVLCHAPLCSSLFSLFLLDRLIFCPQCVCWRIKEEDIKTSSIKIIGASVSPLKDIRESTVGGRSALTKLTRTETPLKDSLGENFRHNFWTYTAL